MKIKFIKPDNKELLQIWPTCPQQGHAAIIEGKTYFFKAVIHDIDAQEIRIILE